MDMTLPTDSKARKGVPMMRGLIDYFPAALAEVARLSQAGNDKHNPGQDLHWSRWNSGDHADCIVRHLVDRGTADPEDGFLHDVKVAWRALAQLQEALEARGAPLARGARVAPAEPTVAMRDPYFRHLEESEAPLTAFPAPAPHYPDPRSCPGASLSEHNGDPDGY